ncbi:MAG: monovalent cation/H(+) antiporter subunit G [Chloroflexota bacterium]|nr:monovalent cation/H(+) antiporter subunit G [Chloroflexota bacterium]
MIEILGLVAVWFGVGFCVVGVIGIVRMPDVYCRLHASGKVSTVGLAGLALGAALIMPSAALKLLALALFAVLTLPVSTHAIAAAAHRHGVPMYRVRRAVSRPAPLALPEGEYQDGRSAA